MVIFLFLLHVIYFSAQCNIPIKDFPFEKFFLNKVGSLPLPHKKEVSPQLYWTLCGVHNFINKNYKKSYNCFLKSVGHEINPFYHYSYALMVKSAFLSKKYKQAYFLSKKFLKKFPKNPIRQEMLLLEIASINHYFRKYRKAKLREMIAIFNFEFPGQKISCKEVGKLPFVSNEYRIRLFKLYFNMEHYEKALSFVPEITAKVLEKHKEFSDEKFLRMYARALFKEQKLKKALNSYHLIYQKFNDLNSLFWTIKLNFYTNQDKEGLKLLQFVYKINRKNRKIKRRIRDYYMRFGYYDDSLKIAEELIKKGTRWSISVDDLWKAGFLAFKTKDYRKCIYYLEKLIKKRLRTKTRCRVSYWLAKAYLKLGYFNASLNFLNRTIAFDPSGYYGMLASWLKKELLKALNSLKNNGKSFVFEVLNVNSKPQGRIRENCENSIGISIKIDGESLNFQGFKISCEKCEISKLSDIVQNQNNLTQLFKECPFDECKDILFFMKHKKFELANLFLNILYKRFRIYKAYRRSLYYLIRIPPFPIVNLKNLYKSYWGHLINPGWYKSKYRTLKRKNKKFIKKFDSIAKSIFEFAKAVGKAHLFKYLIPTRFLTIDEKVENIIRLPLYKFDVIKSLARSVDPFLIMALIYKESFFNEIIESPAGARGLMQIIRKTGRMIKKELKDKNFDFSTLFYPEKNLAYGIFYFSKLLKRYDGNEILAIGSYNAGAFYMDQWLKRKGRYPIDEFVEEIPFTETRHYVKKIISIYNKYKETYCQSCSFSFNPTIKVRLKKDEFY